MLEGPAEFSEIPVNPEITRTIERWRDDAIELGIPLTRHLSEGSTERVIPTKESIGILNMAMVELGVKKGCTLSVSSLERRRRFSERGFSAWSEDQVHDLCVRHNLEHGERRIRNDGEILFDVSSAKDRLVAWNNREISNGEFYGYPSCCIKEYPRIPRRYFVQRSMGLSPPPFDYTQEVLGWVPCSVNCARTREAGRIVDSAVDVFFRADSENVKETLKIRREKFIGEQLLRLRVGLMRRLEETLRSRILHH